jgi:chemotaxis protein methyltransferase CheR
MPGTARHPARAAPAEEIRCADRAAAAPLLGTDLSTQVLEKARAARYLQIEVNRGLPAPLLVKYFLKQGLDWQLKENVKRMVRFERVDLRQPMAVLGPFDVVLCRNILIYFDAATRLRI